MTEPLSLAEIMEAARLKIKAMEHAERIQRNRDAKAQRVGDAKVHTKAPVNNAKAQQKAQQKQEEREARAERNKGRSIFLKKEMAGTADRVAVPKERPVRSPRVPPNDLDTAPISSYDTSHCPHCGSTNRIEHILNLTHTKHYYCKDCYSSWPDQGYRHFDSHGNMHDLVCWDESLGVGVVTVID